MDFRFFINNTLVLPPDNWQGLEIQCSFDALTDMATIETGILSWMAENAKLLNQWVKDGLTGAGPGLFEGPALRIEAGDGGSWLPVFNGCVDMTTADTTFTCDIVKAQVREDKIDWLNDIADTLSFAQMAADGLITKADYVAVPYVVNSIPDYTQVALLGISLFMMEKELEEVVEKTAALIADLTADTTGSATVVGAPSSLPRVIADILKITLYIAYLLAIIIAMIELFRALVNNLIQPLKYKYGMKVKTLFEKACASLDNLPFDSTILQTAPFNNAVIIPKKSAKNNNPTFVSTLFGNSFSRKNYDDTLNPDAYGYYEGSFKELILAMNDVFNAKATIRDNGVFNVFHYEIWDHFNNQAAVTLPPISSNPPFDDPYGTNASELVANYFLKFQYDTSELNTLNQYDGSTYQMLLKPLTIINTRNVLLKGLLRKDLQFALAKRKTDFTVIEKVVQILYSIVRAVYNLIVGFFNTVISVINGIISVINTLFNANIPTIPPIPTLPQSIIDKRLNAMLLETDFIGVPKLVLVRSDGYLDPSNDTIMTAKYLMDNFHSHSWAVNLLAPPMHNQYLTFKNKEIPMCLSDFVKIKGNNIILDSQNRLGRIDSMRWNGHKETAIIDYRVKEKWTNNLQQWFIEDGN